MTKSRVLPPVVLVFCILLAPNYFPLVAQQKLTASASVSTEPASGGIEAGAANDPTAPIPQVQIKDGYHNSYYSYSARGQGNSLLIRPVIPTASQGVIPSAIYRIVMPVESESNGRSGLGDIQIDTFFFPKFMAAQRPKIVMGIGPLITASSATSRYTGEGQWQVGNSAVFMCTGMKGLLLGMIETDPITVSGVRAQPSSNVVTIQPLIVKSFPNKMYLRFDSYWALDIKQHGTATIPLNLGFGRVMKLGKQEFSAYIQPEFLARRPSYPADMSPRFTLRFAVTLLYPKKKRESCPAVSYRPVWEKQSICGSSAGLRIPSSLAMS